MVEVELGPLALSLKTENAAAGFIFADGCVCQPAPAELEDRLDRAIARTLEHPLNERVFQEVRALLRFGKYKPTGRGKPASEYLFRAAIEGRFPRINNLVDINNLVSLESGLPISLVDVDRADSRLFTLRRGRAGESYVFNAGGQIIDLEDLLLLSHGPGDVPCANPVKDSMATKLGETTGRVLAVIYAPVSMQVTLEAALNQFSEALWRFARPRDVFARAIVT